jgi:hypothetical protein
MKRAVVCAAAVFLTMPMNLQAKATSGSDGAVYASAAPRAEVARIPDEAESSAAKLAEQRGAEMYTYDQAAWHGTDRFRADITAAGIEFNSLPHRGIKGYLVEPGDGKALILTFYGEDAAGRWAFARYRYEDGRISGEGLLPPGDRQQLSPVAGRMADARRVALLQFQKPGHELCSSSPPNTLVLPSPDGGSSVYVMTSTTDPTSYPAGGHYRFDVSASGQLTGERRFMKSCFPVNFGEKDGKRPEMVFLTHLLDPQPTEIHAFVSQNIPLPLAIGTVANRMIWIAYRGKINFIRSMDQGQ